VVELVDTADLKSAGESRAGSNPASRTKYLTVVQGIEQQPSKLWVAGSIPAGQAKYAPVAQLVRAGDS
jgi:hypothetical protein